jgi:hypothetical protein
MDTVLINIMSRANNAWPAFHIPPNTVIIDEFSATKAPVWEHIADKEVTVSSYLNSLHVGWLTAFFVNMICLAYDPAQATLVCLQYIFMNHREQLHYQPTQTYDSSKKWVCVLTIAVLGEEDRTGFIYIDTNTMELFYPYSGITQEEARCIKSVVGCLFRWAVQQPTGRSIRQKTTDYVLSANFVGSECWVPYILRRRLLQSRGDVSKLLINLRITEQTTLHTEAVTYFHKVGSVITIMLKNIMHHVIPEKYYAKYLSRTAKKMWTCEVDIIRKIVRHAITDDQTTLVTLLRGSGGDAHATIGGQWSSLLTGPFAPPIQILWISAPYTTVIEHKEYVTTREQKLQVMRPATNKNKSSNFDDIFISAE